MSFLTRILRGGVQRAILYREDTADVVDVRAAVMPARDGTGLLGVTRDRAVTAAGSRQEKGREHDLQLLISDMAAVEALTAWGVAKARAVVLGSAAGVHRLWDEPVRLEIEEADSGSGAFAGYVVRLFSARFEAAVHLSDDLLAGVSPQIVDIGEPSVVRWTRRLPAPGLWVWAAASGTDEITIRALADGSEIESESSAAYASLRLPQGVTHVQVSVPLGAARSILAVRAPRTALGPEPTPPLPSAPPPFQALLTEAEEQFRTEDGGHVITLETASEDTI